MTGVQNSSVLDKLLRLMPVTSDVCPLNGTYADPISSPFMTERLLASLVANGMYYAAGAVELWEPNPDNPSSASEYWRTLINNNIDGHNDGNYDGSKFGVNPPSIVLTFQGYVPRYR